MRLNENNLRGLEGPSLIHLAGEDCLDTECCRMKPADFGYSSRLTHRACRTDLFRVIASDIQYFLYFGRNALMLR